MTVTELMFSEFNLFDPTDLLFVCLSDEPKLETQV